MTKRKRIVAAEEEGVAATLAHIREQAAADDEGWTTIGAPKKRRVQEAPLCGGASIEAPHTPPIEQKPAINSAPNASIEKAVSLPNPFSTSAEPPTNPFSTKKLDTSIPTVVSSTDTPSRASSEERKQAKIESRKQRKIDRHYPVIEHSHLARLKSHVKIADLQSLILYILADGSAPQWVAVQNRAHIKQVVVLLVPGLELGMFTGKVPLEASQSAQSANGDDASKPEGSSEPELTNTTKRLTISPDDYYPAALKRDHLPDVLKPLCDMFSNVWPVKGSAEQRNRQYFRIHSPIHQMLTSQIPKTQDEKKFKKQQKGPVPQNSRHWDDKRTPISKYIADLAEQLDSNIVPHPAWFETPEAKEAEIQRRNADRQGPAHGWVDSHVESLGEGLVKDFQQGSLTEGRNIIAVDCEMCKSEDDEQVLTRISLTNWDGEVIMDELVKPDVPIKDYLTQ